MTLAAVHVIGDIGDGRWRTRVDFAVRAHGGSFLQCLFLLGLASSFFLGGTCGSALFGSFSGSCLFGFVRVLVVGPREGDVRRCSMGRCETGQARGRCSCWGRTCVQPKDQVSLEREVGWGSRYMGGRYLRLSKRRSSRRRPKR